MVHPCAAGVCWRAIYCKAIGGCEPSISSMTSIAPKRLMVCHEKGKKCDLEVELSPCLKKLSWISSGFTLDG